MRKLIALTFAGWLLALSPSAVAALCLGSQTESCCCAKARACFCRDAQQSDPAPAPAAPTAKAVPDQPAEAVVGSLAGVHLAPLAAALTVCASAPAQAPAPIFITGCAFRC